MRIFFLMFLTLASTACATASEKPLFAQSPEEIFSDEKVVDLTRAAMKGDIERVNQLSSTGVDVNSKGKGGLNPLVFSMLAGNVDGFEALLDQGADPNQLLDSGRNVTYYAASASYATDEFMKVLIEHGTDLNVTVISESPIFQAASDDSLNRLQMMINAGSDIEKRDFSQDTPLLHAAGMRQWGAVVLLLKSGAQHDVKNRWNNGLPYFFERDVDIKDEHYYEAMQMYCDLENRRPSVCAYLKAEK